MSKQERPNSRLPLPEHIRRMSRDELSAALRRTAEGDRTHGAEQIASFAQFRGEALQVLEEESEYLIEAAAQLFGIDEAEEANS